MKLKKGDKVKILAGKDAGQTGTIDRVFEKSESVIIGGLNLFKKHIKPRTREDQKSGGIVSVSRPVRACKVSLICPKCGKPTRVGYSMTGKDKVRICKKCKVKI